MINLYITSENKYKINKRVVHKIIRNLKNEFNFTVNSLTINFVSVQTILEVNIKYLNHNYSTDIITFSYSEKQLCLEGDIFISIEDVKENSKKYNCGFQLEILRVVIHGILHMIGYNDIKKAERIKMKKIENSLVKKYSWITDSNKIMMN